MLNRTLFEYHIQILSITALVLTYLLHTHSITMISYYTPIPSQHPNTQTTRESSCSNIIIIRDPHPSHPYALAPTASPMKTVLHRRKSLLAVLACSAPGTGMHRWMSCQNRKKRCARHFCMLDLNLFITNCNHSRIYCDGLTFVHRDRDMATGPKKLSIHDSTNMIRSAVELSSRFSIGSSR